MCSSSVRSAHVPRAGGRPGWAEPVAQVQAGPAAPSTDQVRQTQVRRHDPGQVRAGRRCVAVGLAPPLVRGAAGLAELTSLVLAPVVQSPGARQPVQVPSLLERRRLVPPAPAGSAQQVPRLARPAQVVRPPVPAPPCAARAHHRSPPLAAGRQWGLAEVRSPAPVADQTPDRRRRARRQAPDCRAGHPQRTSRTSFVPTISHTCAPGLMALTCSGVRLWCRLGRLRCCRSRLWHTGLGPARVRPASVGRAVGPSVGPGRPAAVVPPFLPVDAAFDTTFVVAVVHVLGHAERCACGDDARHDQRGDRGDDDGEPCTTGCWWPGHRHWGDRLRWRRRHRLWGGLWRGRLGSGRLRVWLCWVWLCCGVRHVPSSCARDVPAVHHLSQHRRLGCG